MTQGFDGNLQVLRADAFQEMYRQAASLNIADPLARLLRRLVLGSAVETPVTQASIEIPGNLKEFANLKQDVLLVGQGDYFEIWDPDLWGRQESQLRAVDVNSGRFAALKLATRPRPTA